MVKVDNVGTQGNIRKYYWYCFFFLFVLFEPIAIIYFQERILLSLTQIFFAVGLFVLLTGLLEIPTGVIGDKLGYKKTLLLGALAFIIATIGYALANNFYHILLAEIFWAFGFSLTSGTADAFLYDSMKNIGREDEFKKINGRAHAIFWVGLALASIIGGLLAKIDLGLPFRIGFIPFIIQFFIVLSFTEPVREKSELSNFKHVIESIKYILSHKKLKLFIFYIIVLAVVLEGAYTFFQPFMQNLGINIVFFGVIFAVGYLFSATGSLLSNKIDSLFGEKKFLFFIFISTVISLVILSFVNVKIALLGILIFLVLDGISGPILIDYLNKHIESHNRATVNSVANLSRTLVAAICMPILGRVADVFGINMSFLSLLIFMIVGLVIFVIWSNRISFSNS